MIMKERIEIIRIIWSFERSEKNKKNGIKEWKKKKRDDGEGDRKRKEER